MLDFLTLNTEKSRTKVRDFVYSLKDAVARHPFLFKNIIKKGGPRALSGCEEMKKKKYISCL